MANIFDDLIPESTQNIFDDLIPSSPQRQNLFDDLVPAATKQPSEFAERTKRGLAQAQTLGIEEDIPLGGTFEDPLNLALLTTPAFMGASLPIKIATGAGLGGLG